MGRSKSSSTESLDAARARIMDVAQAYSASQALLTANNLGLLQALAGGPRSFDTLRRRSGCSRRGLRALLDALAALDLVRFRAGRVRLAPGTAALFDPGSPTYLGDVLDHQSRLYARWGRLERAVRSGQPVVSRAPRPAQRKQFLKAMVGGSRRSIEQTWRLVDLSGARRLLDLGGGLGSYAIAARRIQPRLACTVFDLPAAIHLTQRYLQAEGLAGRIRCLSGDARRDDVGGPYDVILISNVLHMFSRRDNLRILVRARRALGPAGLLLVKDFVLHRDRSGPRRAGLFGLNMLLATEGGELYTDAEFEGLFRRAGLKRISHHPIGEGSRLHKLVAR